MSATEAIKSIEQHLEAFVQSAREKLEQDLPVVEKTVADAESNPVVAALAGAAHLTAVPEVLSALASVVGVLDAAIGNAKAQGAAEAQQAAAAAAQPEQPQPTA